MTWTAMGGVDDRQGRPPEDVLPDGDELTRWVAELLPLPRSLTGDGVRRTLEVLAARSGQPITTIEVPTGTSALDWEVPEEWTLRRAVLTGPDGEVVADSDVHPLHVLGYSTPVDVALDLDELQAHLWSDPDMPDHIPYRTSYYSPRWGFCLPHRQRESLRPGRYHARVDADLGPGHMSYGELVLPGEGDGEILVCSHVCHPGMANDNASGNVVAAALARVIAGWRRRLTWRFLWMPGTIGELSWLATHDDVLAGVVGGIVLAGVGDPGPLTWKQSRHGDSVVDRAVHRVLVERGDPHAVAGYTPWGYAERQFNSLGIDLAVGRLSRTEHGTYPEYHTSADDLSLVSGDRLRAAAEVCVDVAWALEANAVYRNDKPMGEPRLGPRGLYPSIGGEGAAQAQLALLWVLSESDGRTDLLDIADRSGLPLRALVDAATALAGTDLLSPISMG
jgi:aminopeptidase-like protein